MERSLRCLQVQLGSAATRKGLGDRTWRRERLVLVIVVRRRAERATERRAPIEAWSLGRSVQVSGIDGQLDRPQVGLTVSWIGRKCD